MKQMKKLASALLVLLLLTSLSIPAAMAAEMYRETTGDIYIRKGAGTNYDRVTDSKGSPVVIPKGDVVVVKNSMFAEWWMISYTNANRQTYEGFVKSSYLKETNKRSNEKKNTAPLGCYSTTLELNLRSGRGTSYRSRTSVPKGNVVNVTDTTDESWYGCTFINKKGKKFTGYMSSRYLKKAPEPYNVKSKTQLRRSASTSSTNLQTLPKGSYLFVTAVYSSRWFKVDYPDINGVHHTGYVLRSKVKKGTITNKPYKQVDPEAEAKWMAQVWRSKTRYQLTAKTKMTRSASSRGKKVTTLSKGSVVAVGGSSGKYYKVVWNDSKNKKKLGYLPKSKLTKFKDPNGGDYVTKVQTSLRKDDSQTSEVLVKLDTYTLFQVKDSTEKNWLWGSYTDSKGKKYTGFVYKSHAKKYVEKNGGSYHTVVATQLRKTASDTGTVAAELPQNVLVKVKQTYNPDWYYVSYTNGRGKTSKGYVDSGHLARFQSQKLDYVAYVATPLRSQPDDSAQKMVSINQGQAVTVRDQLTDEWYWASVTDEDGEKHTGFVYAPHLKTREEYDAEQQKPEPPEETQPEEPKQEEPEKDQLQSQQGTEPEDNLDAQSGEENAVMEPGDADAATGEDAA